MAEMSSTLTYIRSIFGSSEAWGNSTSRIDRIRGLGLSTIAHVERIRILKVAAGPASSAEDVFCEGIVRIWVVGGVWEDAPNGDFHYL